MLESENSRPRKELGRLQVENAELKNELDEAARQLEDLEKASED